MRFIVDECVGPSVVRWLKQFQHDVFSVYDEARGLDDEGVLKKAFLDNRILITNDKDFGEMVFREGKAHKGIILLRLGNECGTNNIRILEQLFNNYADRLADHFVVVSETTVRLIANK